MLTGQNLGSATAVSFNGADANFTANADGTLTATVPTGASSGNVTVTTPGGVSNGLAFTVTTTPTVMTGGISIRATSASVGGTLTSDGGAALTSYGIAYVAGNSTPTTANSTVVVGTSSPASFRSDFDVILFGLTPGTRYSAVAYATNSQGTSYGNLRTFTTLATVPTVTTSTVATRTTDTTLGGNVTADGGAPVTGRGLVYSLTSTNSTPTLGGSGVMIALNGSGTGSFSATITGLMPGTSYSVQAYATNSVGNSYGGVQTFTTPAAPALTATVSTTAGSPTSTAPIPFTVTFSEPVTGLSASSFTVSNGTVTSGPTGSGAGPYTFSITPASSGAVAVSINANAVQNAATNGNTASNAVSVQYTAPVASGLGVLYQMGDLGQPTDGQLRPFLQLVNSGSTAVPYSSLTVRYWLTAENFRGSLVTPIDYAKLGTSFVSARYVQLATPRQGALGYIEYSFAAGAGNLAAGTDSGPLYGKAYKPDYSNLDETDDWSYQTSSSFTANDHLTLYQNGTLVAGTEPPAVTSATALNVYSASRDASPSTSYVSVQLQVRNTGNVPVNYSDLTVRYYFTRDGATGIVPELDYAQLGNGNISLRVVNLPSAVSGADAYLEIGFSAALGVFYPRTSTNDILLKLRKDTYQALDQTNDYSYTGSTALQVNNRFPAYLNGSLVFGSPPAGTAARPATSLASASAVGGPLAVALTGSPNPTRDQLQLEFSLAYTQAYALALYDGQGRLVRQLPGGTAPAGRPQQLTLPVQELAAGLYLVRLTTATDQQQLKFIKQ